MKSKKMITALFILFSFINATAFAQDDFGYKELLLEPFNNNNNGWHTENSELRYAQITDGKLIDRFSEEGYVMANVVPINLNEDRTHKIFIAISNINGDASKKYRIYKKKNNGSLKKKWEENPKWGFVWGFKDWENYNCILFYNRREYNRYTTGNYLYSTKVKVFYKSNGQQTTLLDWKDIQYYVGTNENYIVISLYDDNSSSIKIGNTTIYRNYEGAFQWYGNYVGPYIGAGAKVSLSLLMVHEDLPHPNTSWNEQSLKSHWKNNGIDEIEGIYENAVRTENTPKYKLGLIKSDDGYELIYLSGAENPDWRLGDIKAYLTKTATQNLYKVKYFMGNKSLNEDLYIIFEKGLMKLTWTDNEREETLYVKLYPTFEGNENIFSNVKSTGTGFAISNDGYIVTNYHVIKYAKNISVRGVNGNFNEARNATIIIEDKNNDLAIIKVDTQLGDIPYSLDFKPKSTGKSVFALGYPLLSSMGDEIKLTNGIISSRSGFQGDITSYQTSVPAQPGNSGGPLFDKDGNIIGVINAEHNKADNATYAIKANYLNNLIQALDTKLYLKNQNSKLSNLNLVNQVKKIQDFVYIIEIK